MSIKNVVFDFGHVIIDWRPYLAVDELFENEAEMDRTFKEIGFYPWNLKLDRGLGLDEGLDEVRRDQPENAHIFQMYLDRIDRAHSQTMPGTCDVVEALAGGEAALFGLTNANAKAAAAVQELTPAVRHFRDVVVSAEVRLMKPEPEIFEVLLERNGLSAPETLFVDDSAANCEAARSLGLHAHQFHSAESLSNELRQHGLI